MSKQPLEFTVSRDDPHFLEKAKAFILEAYRNQQAERTKSPAQVEDNAAPRGTLKINGEEITLDAENIPDEHIEPYHVRKLVNYYCFIDMLMKAPPPDTDDANTASLCTVILNLFEMSQAFVIKLIAFLTLDSRFHPERRGEIPSAQCLALGNDAAEEEEVVTSLRYRFEMMELCLAVAAIPEHYAIVDIARKTLRDTADMFFITLNSVFDLRAIGKCQRSFWILMDALGGSDISAPLRDYVRRRRIMQREIENFVKNGGDVNRPMTASQCAEMNRNIALQTEELSTMSGKLDKSIKANETHHRKQSAMFSSMKKSIRSFVLLFRPQQQAPTYSEIRAQLDPPPETFACLDNITVIAHRTQVKAVIDYTWKHPIVYRLKKKTDFALANAVHEVWLANGDKWLKSLAGAYDSEDKLKSACYNIQKKYSGKNDPFRYVP